MSIGGTEVTTTTVEFKGATLTFDGSYITYEPNRAMRMMLGKQGFRLPVSAVQYVEYRAPKMMTNGFLRVNTGEPPLEEPMEAIRDQHSFHFEGKKVVPAVEAMKDVLERALANRSASAGAAVPVPAVDHSAALTQLAKLRDQGILTDEEFTAKKAEILSRI